MTLRLDLATVVFDEFGCLEPAEPRWLAEKDYWEDFNARFFRSNGLDYGPELSNVDTWLTAPDRAPYAFMARELLSRLGRTTALDDIEFVLLAHWLPDLHLGTSVTNFVQHQLGLSHAFGFAISDRDRSAPLFALNCIDAYLKRPGARALLLVMDQKHLLYRSKLIDTLDPVNSAAAMILERGGAAGLTVLDYQHLPQTTPDRLADAVVGLCHLHSFDPARTTLVADPKVLHLANHPGPTRAQDPRHLCAAPFAALARSAETLGDTLVLAHDGETLTAIALAGEPERVPA
jgi:hypothetical protein